MIKDRCRQASCLFSIFIFNNCLYYFTKDLGTPCSDAPNICHDEHASCHPPFNVCACDASFTDSNGVEDGGKCYPSKFAGFYITCI